MGMSCAWNPKFGELWSCSRQILGSVGWNLDSSENSLNFLRWVQEICLSYDLKMNNDQSQTDNTVLTAFDHGCQYRLCGNCFHKRVKSHSLSPGVIFRNCNHTIYNSPKTQSVHVTKWVFIKLFIVLLVKAQNATEKDMKMGKHVFSMHVDVPSSLTQLEQFSKVRGRRGKALGTAGLTDSWVAWLFCIFVCQLPEIKARRCVPGAHAGPGK